MCDVCCVVLWVVCGSVFACVCSLRVGSLRVWVGVRVAQRDIAKAGTKETENVSGGS